MCDWECEEDPLVAYKDDGNELHQPYLAFNQGYAAADRGYLILHNPYELKTIEYDWWEDGYQTSKEQDEEFDGSYEENPAY